MLRPLTDALGVRSSPAYVVGGDDVSLSADKTVHLAAATLLVHPVSDAELRVHTDASSGAIAGAIHQVI